MAEKQPKSSTPQAVEECHALLLWMIPALDKLPRKRRFTLGERLESCLLDVLRCLVAAAYTRDKTELLQSANHQLAVARHLWRLSMELGDVPQRNYRHGAGLMLALGAQIGGWLKSRSSVRNPAIRT